MTVNIEEVLKLPREEKIELLHALQEDLQDDGEILVENDLTADEWAEIYKREKMLENGEMKWIGKDEFDDFLNKRKNAL